MFTGRLYAIDSDLNLLILCVEQASRRDYHFINAEAIELISALDCSPVLLDASLPSLDVSKMLREVRSEMRRKASQMAKMNFNASSEAQFIFKELSKTYECDWEDEVIVIRALEASLRPPYTHIASREIENEYLSKVVRPTQLLRIREKFSLTEAARLN